MKALSMTTKKSIILYHRSLILIGNLIGLKEASKQ